MTKSLQSLINDSYARSGVKVASAADAPQAAPTIDDDFLTSTLGLGGDAPPPAPAETPKVASQTEAEAIANLDYAEKLASALEHAAIIVTKTASSPMDAPGPSVVEPPRAKETSTVPTATTTAHKDMDGGSKPEDTQGNPNGIQTDKAIHGDPDWTKNKEAAVLFAQAKLASAEQFVDSHPEIAQTLLDEAQEVAKLAGFEIAPAKGLPAHSDDAKVRQDSGHSSVMPDNAGAIRMTKSEARDSTTREAKERMSETPKKDNAVAANAATTTGLKLSSDQILDKIAASVGEAGANLAEDVRERGIGLSARKDQYSLAPLLPFGSTYVGASRAGMAGESRLGGAAKGVAGGMIGRALGAVPGALVSAAGGGPAGLALGAIGGAAGDVIGTDLATHAMLRRGLKKQQKQTKEAGVSNAVELLAEGARAAGRGVKAVANGTAEAVGNAATGLGSGDLELNRQVGRRLLGATALGTAGGAAAARKGNAEKKASADDLMKTASFLQSVEQMAASPEATAEDKEKAASLLGFAQEHGLAATHELLEEA